MEPANKKKRTSKRHPVSPDQVKSEVTPPSAVISTPLPVLSAVVSASPATVVSLESGQEAIGEESRRRSRRSKRNTEARSDDTIEPVPSNVASSLFQPSVTEEAQSTLENPKYPVGTKFHKYFLPQGMYGGEIVSHEIEAETGKILNNVRYFDPSDPTEDLYDEELESDNVKIVKIASSSTGTARPDQVSSNRKVASLLEDAELDYKIKKEGDKVKLTHKQSEDRRRHLDAWIKANTDPATGEGRQVFRRACHENCLTQILGGSGMVPWPIVEHAPENPFTGSPNRFIQPGQFYVAGNEAWNPYGPIFPGAEGLVNIDAFAANNDQKEFHFFVQCSTKEFSRHWHGKNAREGRMVRCRMLGA
jgi:hypothetical protein